MSAHGGGGGGGGEREKVPYKVDINQESLRCWKKMYYDGKIYTVD